MPGRAETYICETCCMAVFIHPDVDECRTAPNGGCALMTKAGWVQAWTKGWICPACVKRVKRYIP